MQNIKCKICDKEIDFTTKRSDSIYCSEECRDTAYWKRWWIKNGFPKARENWQEKECPNCKKVFLPDIQHKYQKFCCDKCRDAFNSQRYDENGKKKIWERNYYLRNKEDLLRKSAEYKDRTRFPNYENSRFALKKASLERDNYTCQRCGYNGKRLNTHHNKYPALLDDLINLCAKCHRYIHWYLGGIFYSAKKEEDIVYTLSNK